MPPAKRRRKSRLGDEEVRDVPATRGDIDDREDPMKVDGDWCSKSKGVMQQQRKDREVSACLEQSMPVRLKPDGIEWQVIV